MKKLFLWLPVLACTASFAGVPPEWEYSQTVQVPAPGLTKIRLAEDTLGKAQPTLADLRLLDAEGREIPFFIDQPRPDPARVFPLERMVITMEKKKTVISGNVPAVMRQNGFDAMALFTPTDDFLKPLTLEGSLDGRHWTTLIRQAPIFKQSGDRSSSTLRLPKGSWAAVRLTLDDSDSPPLRVSGVALYGLGRPIKDLVELEPEILELASDAHKTEINLRLPAAGLPIDALRFDVPESTFRRQVRLSLREFRAGEFHEELIASGSIYRITVGTQKSEELVLPVGKAIPGSLVTLTIENGDSPPLTVRHLWTRIIPRDLIFDASGAGTYQLCSGNERAPARFYDMAQLRGSLNSATLQTAVPGALKPNPGFQPPAPEVVGEEEGSDINTDPWHFRKKVSFDASPLNPAPMAEGAGVSLWRIELDPQVIAHNGSRLEALRLVRNDKQLPYIVDYAGVERALPVTLTAQPSPSNGKSRWTLALPEAGLPISHVRFNVPDTLFQRTVTLYEVVPEENPDSSPMRILGSATWTRTRVDGPSNFDLALSQVPRTNVLVLETDNGDNAPIHPTQPQAYYRAPRLLFRSHASKDPLYLFYGQPEVATPQYDLNLIAAVLLSTPPQEARLGAEEALKATPWWEPPVVTGKLRPLFWGVMILVVLGLLGVIAKLLPEEQKGTP